MLLEFSHLGFIGKLFHIKDLHLFVEMILMNYRQLPCDWILDQYFFSRYCAPGDKKCKINEVYRFQRRPALFQVIFQKTLLTLLLI